MIARARLIVLLVLGLASPAAAQMLSPGELSKAHKSLDGDDDCDKCHESGKKISQAKCLGCHKDLGKRISSSKGLHGLQYKGKSCGGKCHVEHIGRNSRLVRWPGGSRNKLNHSLTGWTLKGSHARAGCDKCHNNKNTRGAKTYLGLSTQCSGCHNDPHSGKFGANCTSCHSETKWKAVTIDRFDHSKARFPLKGKHATVKCEKCHGTPRKYRGLQFGSCRDCHNDPHGGRMKGRCEDCHTETGWGEVGQFMKNHPGVKLINGHRRVKCEKCHDKGNAKPPSKGRRCVNCHKPIHKAKFGRNCNACHRSIKWVGLPDKIGAANHAKTAYPLLGRHRKASCKGCHPTSLRLDKRYRGIQFDRCLQCHADKHGGELAARDGGECAQCHTVRGFVPTTFGIDDHATTSFPLIGRHTATRCSGCHKSKRPRLSFKVAEKVCADCHENPHGEQFAAEMKQGGCGQCHSPTAWSNPKIDHSTWPLTGRHKDADCASCHNPSEKDKAAGKGATYRGVPRECEGCHADSHAGQFRLTQPVRKCEDCHETSGFTIEDFDHDKATTFALTGKHKKVECRGCHPLATLRNGQEAIRYRLFYQSCSDCHANPHKK